MRKTKERLHKINNDIKNFKVRLIKQGEAPIIMNTYDAIKLAASEEKDLILISESGDTPVVKMEEYSKFLYNLEKKQKEAKKNSIQTELKELKFSCEIADHDLDTKFKKAVEFLENGDKIKCIIQLKGRQNLFAERGKLVLLRFADMCSEIGTPESFPEQTANKWIMTLKPKFKAKK